MACIINKGLEEQQEQFIVESVSDISNLPTTTTYGNCLSPNSLVRKKVAFGSMALCVDTGDIYVLTTNNQWTKVGG